MRFKKRTLFFLFLLFSTVAFGQETLSLSEAITRSLENNYDVRIVRLNEKAAAITNSWGEAGALPSFAFSFSGTRTRDREEETDTDVVSGGLSLSWILFDGFAVHIRKGRLNDLEKLSEGNTAILVEQTIQAVILSYYNALLQQQTCSVMDTLRLLSKDRFDRAEAQQKLGTLVTYDLLQAKNAWLEDEANFLRQQSTTRNAQRGLNYLMGVQDDVTYALSDPFEAEPQLFSYPAMFEKLKADNATLRNKYVEQRLLEKNVALAASDFAPSVTLRGGIEKSRRQGDLIAITDTYQRYGTLSLSWNLFTGGTRFHAIQVAKLDREIGKTEIESMIHSLANSLATTLENYNVRKQLLEVAEEALKTAELNLKISKEKFKTGAINSFNYRDVQLLYLNASLGKLQSIYNLIDSETELLLLTGGILSSYR